MLKSYVKIFIYFSILIFVSCVNPIATIEPAIEPIIEPSSETDSTPCSDVTELNSQSGNGNLLLTWVNPPEEDYEQAQLELTPEVSTISRPLIVKGTETSVLISGLMNDTEYEIVIKAMDKAGNVSEGVSIKDTPDGDSPTVQLSTDIGDNTNQPIFDVTISFSELVSGFSSEDIINENCILSDLRSIDDQTYAITVEPQNEGAVSLSIPLGSVMDASGNENLSSNTLVVNFDVSELLATITSLHANENGNPIEFNITFNKVTVGFEQSDLILENGFFSSFNSSNNKDFNIQVNPEAEGNVVLSVPENCTADNAGNPNSGLVSSTVNYDITNPTAQITSTISSPVSSAPIPITISFSEWIVSLNDADFSAVNGTVTNIQTADNIIFTAEIIPSGTNVSVSLPANKVEDNAGNFNDESNAFHFVFDSSNPTALVAAAGDSPSNASQFEFNITFSESISGFTSDDVTVLNGSIQSFEFTVDHYNIIVNAISEGDISISIPENICQDPGGNGNFASNSVTSVYDITPPSLPQIYGNSLTENLTPQWTWTGTADVVEYSYRLDSGEWINSDSSTTAYTAPDPLHTGDHIFEIKTRDEAGNWSSAASFTTTIYLEKPEISSIYSRGTVNTRINWENISTTATAYIIERKTGSNGTYTVIKEDDYMYSSSFTDNGPLLENTTYYYRFKVYNHMGESEYSEISTTTPFKPAAPTNLQVELLNDGHISLSWQDNSSDEDGFTIYFDNYDVWGMRSDSTNCIIDYDYHYSSDKIVDIKVVSYKSYGSEEDESEPAIVTGFSLPAIPVSPVLDLEVLDEVQFELNFRDWANNETGFEIERKEFGGEYSVIATLPPSAGTGGWVTYNDISAPGGKILEYRVRPFREAAGIPFKLYCQESPMNIEEGSLPYQVEDFTQVHQNNLVREEQIVWYRFPAISYRNYDVIVKGKNEDSGYTGDIKYSISYHYNDTTTYPTLPNNVTGKTTFNHTIYNQEYMYIYIEGVQATDIGSFSVEVHAYPKISISHGGDPLYNQEIIDIGTVTAGSSQNEAFTINNYGEGLLEINSIDLEQSGSDYSIAPLSEVYPGATLLPGESKQFLLRLSPQSVGPKTVNVEIDTNIYNSETKSFSVNMYSDGNKPILSVSRQSGGVLTHNDFYNMGSLPIGSSISETFTIINNGNIGLELTGVNLVIASGAVSADTTLTESFLAPGESTTFRLTFTSSQPHIHYSEVTIPSNDPDYSPFSIDVGGFGLTPRINIEQNNSELTSGDRYQFEDQLTNGPERTVEFTILNEGNDILDINSITLDDTTNFSIIPPTATTVPVNGSTTFSIVSIPTVVGEINSVVMVNTNDFNQNNFTIPIRSKGVEHTMIDTFGIWFEGNLISAFSGGILYSFDVIAGNTYSVVWNDRENHPSYTGDVVVSCKNSDFLNQYFTNRNDGSSTPPQFTATDTETLILDVRTHYSETAYTGTFSVGVVLE
ncbi:MAG: choice-of-anchor D domain-containing protein [Spirochaetaceae bacterium]|nr:choice-of-anchor D domain-containing protein [Spirochaetaceae bacterium]